MDFPGCAWAHTQLDQQLHNNDKTDKLTMETVHLQRSPQSRYETVTTDSTLSTTSQGEDARLQINAAASLDREKIPSCELHVSDDVEDWELSFK